MNSVEILISIISLLSILDFILDIKNKSFSFLIRYLYVAYRFRDLQVFSNGILDFVVCEMISIGSIVYIISYFLNGILMKSLKIKDRGTWRFTYFIIYIFVVDLLYTFICAMRSENMLPLL